MRPNSRADRREPSILIPRYPFSWWGSRGYEDGEQMKGKGLKGALDTLQFLLVLSEEMKSTPFSTREMFGPKFLQKFLYDESILSTLKGIRVKSDLR